MKLSVVIVNYNVEYFLEQCLNAVLEAARHVETEIFVVDNNSIDGSCTMVKKKFPQVHLIENKHNAGFSMANNQAIRISTGEYVLLLNPDTVVEEDTFSKVVAFMDQHKDAGGLGVKMIDGKGNFLPESKRGLPTPAVAFYKIFGLSTLFPRSKKFGRYHLGFLDKEKTHEIEILSGAFMLLRAETLKKTGLLDEAFFMYGEDIDLSYRIILAGYKNYYFPETRIIHYKGESTKKSSVNYVFVFYNAMVIFAKKHFSEKNAKTFSFLINVAIYLRASIAIFSRFLRRILLPAIDFTLLFFGLFLIADEYQKVKNIDFPDEVLNFALPAYSLTWILSVWLSGGYDKPIRLLNVFKGVLIGTAVILIVYGLLPKDIQFSRIFILLSSVMTLLLYFVTRAGLHFSGWPAYRLTRAKNKRFVIIGKKEEADRVSGLLKQTNNYADFIAYVNPETNEKNSDFIGDINQLYEVVDIHHIDEIIFCARDNSAQQIIDLMSKADNRKVDFKIAQPESLYLIGSNSIDTSGDLYVLDINSVTKVKNRRSKRIFDLLAALTLLIFTPVLVLFNPAHLRAIPRLFKILIGKESVIGYSLTNPTEYRLPDIRKGLLNTCSNLDQSRLSEDLRRKIDIIYAKDYKWYADLQLLWNSLLKIGRN